MPDLSARYDAWHLVMTAIPLATGALGALFVRQRPARLGSLVLVYAVICVGVALSPLWLDRVDAVLVETKFAFVIGLAMLLAAGGRTPRGEDTPPA
ncbi:MAG: hypothetical protein ACYC0B_05475 [Gemmatimonadaceae bacterium]